MPVYIKIIKSPDILKGHIQVPVYAGSSVAGGPEIRIVRVKPIYQVGGADQKIEGLVRKPLPVSVSQMGLESQLHTDAKLDLISVRLLKPMHFPEISVRIQVKAYIGIGVIHIQVLGHAHKRKPQCKALFYHLLRGRLTVPGKTGM